MTPVRTSLAARMDDASSIRASRRVRHGRAQPAACSRRSRARCWSRRSVGCRSFPGGEVWSWGPARACWDRSAIFPNRCSSARMERRIPARSCPATAAFQRGFDARLLAVRGGETVYRVSLLPRGGYVKFAGDNPLEQLAPEDRGRGFLGQPPLKRAAIALAGPAANFLLALVLYFALNASPHRDLASIVGYVKPGSPA